MTRARNPFWKKYISSTILIPFLTAIIIIGVFNMAPTQEKTENFLKENSCNPYALETDSSEEYECAYYLRRHSALILGQIIRIPGFVPLFPTNPFGYFDYDFTDEEAGCALTNSCNEDDHSYVFVITKDAGTLVYNPVNGKFIGKYDELMLDLGCKLPSKKSKLYPTRKSDLFMANSNCLFDRRVAHVEKMKKTNSDSDIQEPNAALVTSVLDGDTFKLSNGETIRLIGLNAPEKGEKCSQEAKDMLEYLILNKEVKLESDLEDRDQHGRLLRYVFEDGHMVNYGMIYLGYAHVYNYASNHKYSELLASAQEGAKEEGCLWKAEDVNYIQDECLSVDFFHFNAAGDDNYNLNDEYLVLENSCPYEIDMQDWTIKDESSSHLYTFSDFKFKAESQVTVFSGFGKNSNSELYWGRSSGDYAAIWNNNGDTLFLRDNEGNLVLTESYRGY